MRSDEKAAIKPMLLLIGVDTVAVSIAAPLVVQGVLSTASLAIFGFCLFWANYMFWHARSGPVSGSWKSLSLLAGAGIYFAGALWGGILFARDRELNEIFGPIFAMAVGAFCLSRSRRLEEKR